MICHTGERIADSRCHWANAYAWKGRGATLSIMTFFSSAMILEPGCHQQRCTQQQATLCMKWSINWRHAQVAMTSFLQLSEHLNSGRLSPHQSATEVALITIGQRVPCSLLRRSWSHYSNARAVRTAYTDRSFAVKVTYTLPLLDFYQTDKGLVADRFYAYVCVSVSHWKSRPYVA